MVPIGLSIIGYGIMGERLLRAALDHDAPTVRVEGVFDPAPESRERLAGTFPALTRFESAQAAIDAAQCVYVASPPATHVDYAARALAADRAVFCEKPLAVDLPMARALVQASEHGRAAVNFPFASSFAVEELRGWLADDTVGAVRNLTIQVGFASWPRAWQVAASSWLEKRAQGGFTREVVSHFLFLAQRLLGPLQLESARATYPPGDGSETELRATLIAAGVPVTLAGGVGTTDKADHNLFILQGSRGSVRLRDWAIAERLMGDGTWQADPDALPNEALRPLVLRRQLDKVAAMTRGEDQNLATLGEALQVQEIVEAMLAED
ncbi:MAG: Gfo/Idh/MocA family oxidoreductase [Pseudomonadota bacterium]